MRTFEWCPSASALVGLFFFLSLSLQSDLFNESIRHDSCSSICDHTCSGMQFFFFVYLHVSGLLHRAFDRVCEQDLFSFFVRTLCAIYNGLSRAAPKMFLV